MAHEKVDEIPDEIILATLKASEYWLVLTEQRMLFKGKTAEDMGIMFAAAMMGDETVFRAVESAQKIIARLKERADLTDEPKVNILAFHNTEGETPTEYRERMGLEDTQYSGDGPNSGCAEWE